VTFRVPTRLTLLTVALLLLLPALAVLQYRWVGQLSDAERERMQRNMRNAAAQFRDAFDGEIARAFIGLQVDGSVVAEQAWDRYAERYAAWAATAAHPALVAHVYLIDGDEDIVRLRAWNSAERRFDPAPWDGPLGASRDYFEQELRARRAGDAAHQFQVPRSMFDVPGSMFGRDDDSLVVAPLVTLRAGPQGVDARLPLVPVFGYTVLHLDMRYVRERLLPDLVERHFSRTDGAGYRVAVIRAANPKQVVYRSSPEATVDPARADASEMLFGAHGDAVMFLTRGAAREAHERSLFVSVIRDKGDAQPTIRGRLFDTAVGRWRVLLQHERGSLEAAVAGVRQRNLIVSFGILTLMGLSIALLALSSRRAQRLARQQMEFVAGVSHELRTPVAVIRSAAENLSHGVVGDPERVRRYGDAIQTEARRLGEMVERVLQFAGIDSGRAIARSPIAVRSLVDDAIAAAVANDGRVNVERHIAPDVPTVMGNRDALLSAVQNLIVNAIKYGGEDHWIGVRVDAAKGRSPEVRIIVEDHGRGVADADLPHIFEPFYRGADAVARQIQGSGLGLSLVRRIAEAHGGRVEVTSGSTGSTFTLRLPAGAEGAGVAEAFTEAVAR